MIRGFVSDDLKGGYYNTMLKLNMCDVERRRFDGS